MNDLPLYVAQWLTLIVVYSLAAISPGPAFIMTVKNSVAHSRRVGVLTAFGLGIGILVHVIYIVLGIATLIAQSALLFSLIKWGGAAYLVFIGVKALRSQGVGQKILDQSLTTITPAKMMGDFAAFRSGFLTNATNPKALLFFIAIFSQILRPDTPLFWQAVYGLTCVVIETSWFSLVSLLLTHKSVRNRFLKSTKWIERTCGGLLILLGIKVALSL